MTGGEKEREPCSVPHTINGQEEALGCQGRRTGKVRRGLQGGRKVSGVVWEEERDPVQSLKRVLQATQFQEPMDAGGRRWGARVVQLQLF